MNSTIHKTCKPVTFAITPAGSLVLPREQQPASRDKHRVGKSMGEGSTLASRTGRNDVLPEYSPECREHGIHPYSLPERGELKRIVQRIACLHRAQPWTNQASPHVYALRTKPNMGIFNRTWENRETLLACTTSSGTSKSFTRQQTVHAQAAHRT